MRLLVVALLALLTACGQIGEEPGDSGFPHTGDVFDTALDEVCDNGEDDDGDGDVDCDDSDCVEDSACTD